MKTKTLFLLLLISFTISNLGAKTFQFEFNLNDFIFEMNNANEISISSGREAYKYDENSMYAFPQVARNIVIGQDETFIGFNIKDIRSRLISQNISIALPPDTYTTDTKATTTSNCHGYGLNNVDLCSFEMKNTWNGCEIIRFLICPFIYEDGDLYIIESFDLDVITEIKNKNFSSIDEKDYYILRQIADNDINNFCANDKSINIYRKTNQNHTGSDNKIDYLIITEERLREVFKPLIDWKRKKGLKCLITTVEDIYSTYDDATNQLKIKRYLHDLHKNNGLRYVLFGGDDNVVPTETCYVDLKRDDVSKDLPCDLFFACFEGQFDWDKNGNGLIGEYEDGIDLHPSIIITRIPVLDPPDATAYVSKLLEYEKTPKYKHNLLTVGTMSTDDPKDKYILNGEISISETRSNAIYNQYIKDQWTGKRTIFFDEHTDFEGDGDYQLNPENFQKELSRGYSFVEEFSHGHVACFRLEDNTFYESKDALNLENNNAHTIITSTACLTNAFDCIEYPGNQLPCLSEAFIRNSNNGVIGYLGCSRQGFFNGNGTLGASDLYESNFYNLLFSEFPLKSFGELVTLSKIQALPFCGRQNTHRYLQLGLNPIGDPEMPVFTETPKEFSGISFKNIDTDSLEINTNVSECSICIMFYEDGEANYDLHRSVDKILHIKKPTSDFNFCVTKHNYIPYESRIILGANPSYSPNKKSVDKLKCFPNPSTEAVNVEITLANEYPDMRLLISDSNGKIWKTINISDTYIPVRISLTDLPIGMYNLTLLSGDQVICFSRIVKQ